MAAPSGTPSSVFKHAIDLNRVSNSLQKPLAVAYNRILVKAARELQAMGVDEYSSSYRAKRLGQIIGSLKTSLDGWAKDSTKIMKTDLSDLAKIETEFAVAQMRQMIGDADDIVRELEVSPQFAEAVVSSDPTKLNLVTTEAGDTLTGKGVYKLTAKQGEALVLPNGETVEKAFRGIATSSAQKFRLVVQDGLLTGVPTKQIVREIIGQHGGMKFASGQKVSARALALAGGEKGTRLANNQIMTLVRTSVNQVANKASQETYKANDSVTKKYRYIATIDSRTTMLCASKDDKLFDYNDGPMPPLHFNCRSTTVPVIDWDGLNKEYGIVAPDDIEGVGKSKRASIDGPIPAGTSYGDWLYDKRIKEGRKVLPGPEQIDALGYDKAVYFNRLAARYKDPNKAIVSLVREDGTEKTLADLRRDYKLKKVVRPSEPTIVIKNEKQLNELAKNIRAAQEKVDSFSKTLAEANPADLTKAGEELLDEVGGLDYAVVSSLHRRFQLVRKADPTRFKKAMDIYIRGADKFEKKMEKVRQLMMKTKLSDIQVEQLIKDVRITTGFKSVEKKQLRGYLNEYIRMFNGNGFVKSKNGVPAIATIGKAQRGSCKFYKGSLTTSVGSLGTVNKGTTFHEISHAVEAANPKLNKWTVSWRNKKAFTSEKKIRERLINKNAYSVYGPSQQAGKPAYRLKDLTKINYKNVEDAVVNDYLDPYMGKVYMKYDFSRFGIEEGVDPTEVLSMGVEHFDSASHMTKLFRQHPELFKMIVGMSRAGGL